LAKPIERISFVQADNLEPTMMAIPDLPSTWPRSPRSGGPLVIGAIAASHSLAGGGAAELPAEARLMNIDKWLAAGEADIRSAGSTQLVAHATSTYSIPQQ
jgi:hypothetical protein